MKGMRLNNKNGLCLAKASQQKDVPRYDDLTVAPQIYALNMRLVHGVLAFIVSHSHHIVHGASSATPRVITETVTVCNSIAQWPLPESGWIVTNGTTMGYPLATTLQQNESFAIDTTTPGTRSPSTYTFAEDSLTRSDGQSSFASSGSGTLVSNVDASAVLTAISSAISSSFTSRDGGEVSLPTSTISASETPSLEPIEPSSGSTESSAVLGLASSYTIQPASSLRSPISTLDQQISSTVSAAVSSAGSSASSAVSTALSTAGLSAGSLVGSSAALSSPSSAPPVVTVVSLSTTSVTTSSTTSAASLITRYYISGGTVNTTVIGGATRVVEVDGEPTTFVEGGFTTSYTFGGRTSTAVEVATASPVANVADAVIGVCPGYNGRYLNVSNVETLVACGVIYNGTIIPYSDRRRDSILKRATPQECRAQCLSMVNCVGYSNTQEQCVFYSEVNAQRPWPYPALSGLRLRAVQRADDVTTSTVETGSLTASSGTSTILSSPSATSIPGTVDPSSGAPDSSVSGPTISPSLVPVSTITEIRTVTETPSPSAYVTTLVQSASSYTYTTTATETLGASTITTERVTVSTAPASTIYSTVFSSLPGQTSVSTYLSTIYSTVYYTLTATTATETISTTLRETSTLSGPTQTESLFTTVRETVVSDRTISQTITSTLRFPTETQTQRDTTTQREVSTQRAPTETRISTAPGETVVTTRRETVVSDRTITQTEVSTQRGPTETLVSSAPAETVFTTLRETVVSDRTVTRTDVSTLRFPTETQTRREVSTAPGETVFTTLRETVVSDRTVTQTLVSTLRETTTSSAPGLTTTARETIISSVPPETQTQRVVTTLRETVVSDRTITQTLLSTVRETTTARETTVSISVSTVYSALPASTYTTTYETTYPASTFTTTAPGTTFVTTQSASTATVTSTTTAPASTVVSEITYTVTRDVTSTLRFPTETATLISSAPGQTSTERQTTTAPASTERVITTLRETVVSDRTVTQTYVSTLRETTTSSAPGATSTERQTTTAPASTERVVTTLRETVVSDRTVTQTYVSTLRETATSSAPGQTSTLRETATATTHYHCSSNLCPGRNYSDQHKPLYPTGADTDPRKDHNCCQHELIHSTGFYEGRDFYPRTDIDTRFHVGTDTDPNFGTSGEHYNRSRHIHYREDHNCCQDVTTTQPASTYVTTASGPTIVSTLVSTDRTTLPASTLVTTASGPTVTSQLPASTRDVTSTLISTRDVTTTQPASTYVTTASGPTVTSQLPASTIVSTERTTARTTLPASTVTSQLPASTIVSTERTTQSASTITFTQPPTTIERTTTERTVSVSTAPGPTTSIIVTTTATGPTQSVTTTRVTNLPTPTTGQNIMRNYSFENFTGRGFEAEFDGWSKTVDGISRLSAQSTTIFPIAYDGITVASMQCRKNDTAGGVGPTLVLSQSTSYAPPGDNVRLTYFTDLFYMEGAANGTTCTLTTLFGGDVVRTRTYTSADPQGYGTRKIPEVIDGIILGPDKVLDFRWQCNFAAGTYEGYLYVDNVFLGRPAPFTTCDNQGVQYEAVVNDQPGHVNNAYTAYNPAYLKATSQGGTNQRIYNIGTHTTFAGFVTTCPNNAASNVTFYNSPTPYSCQQFSLNHRGYFYIYATGVWTFTATLVDDAFIFWGGWFARKGWTKANSDISSWFTYGPGNGRGSVSLTLTAGTYLPVRVVFGQAVGGAGFNLNITDPSGAVALDTRTVSSPYLVRFSCDGQAPPYNYDFGQEI
ncbi:unnamed protein product [Zymoseptoria tritici ST99CH_1E4]|uniref:PA14 domain-containing protein n=1 Tax=Zymoseptoria tritici ST99CH_1E4 TaxID=1276532 RepID=A0A2H1GP88_ZYMTR|nr:unnamed protein product [Zymoseptoria tritici ST99CH_1E4]